MYIGDHSCQQCCHSVQYKFISKLHYEIPPIAASIVTRKGGRYWCGMLQLDDVVEAHCYVVDIGRTDREQIRSRINNN